MRNPVLKRFTVEGVAAFPLDMLRIDQGWPATPADTARIVDPALVDAADHPPRTVTIETAAKYAPDRRSWLRAAWRVLD